MRKATLDIHEARKQFHTIDDRLKNDHVIIITRHHKKAFAVVDLDYLSAVLETIEILSDPQATRMLRHSVEDVRAGRIYSQDGVEKELG